jgi:hypothetical protein
MIASAALLEAGWRDAPYASQIGRRQPTADFVR